MSRRKALVAGTGLLAVAVLGWLALSWLAAGLGLTATVRGSQAEDAVERMFEGPLPQGAEVVAVHRGGFQDPFAQIRIDAPHHLRGTMLAYLHMPEDALSPGLRRIGADQERWWTLPAAEGALFGNPELDLGDGVDLLIVPLAEPAGHDAYLIYVWTM